VGRIAFDGTGALLTGTGDAGDPQLAEDSSSLAGKVLRTNDIGQPSSDNPVAGSAVYAEGFHSVDGLCVDPQSGQRVVITDTVPDSVDLIGAGADFGDHGDDQPAGQLPDTAQGGGGCAMIGGTVIVATRTGQSLVAAPISKTGQLGKPTLSLTKKYGRLRTVVAGSDGALWITTSNRDGQGDPIPTDDRVIRIDPSAAGGGSVL
jgi:glucose/arabinose dehydrogenase